MFSIAFATSGEGLFLVMIIKEIYVYRWCFTGNLPSPRTKCGNVGNHTFNHPNVIGMSEEQFGKELSMVSDKFKEITGKEMTKFYRAPQGKLSFDNLKMAQKLGYKTFFWSLAYVDWNTDAQPTKEEAFSKLLTRVHPGAIVLLHNTSSTNGEILDELLEKWEDMGYKFGKLQDIK